MGSRLSWLVEREYWFVAPLIAAGSLNPGWMPFALGFAALFWPIRRLAKGRWSVRTPVDWPLLLLALILPVNLWATSAMQITLPQIMRLMAGVVLFYSLVNWASDRGRLRLAVNLVTGLGLMLALVSPFVVQWNEIKLGFIPSGLYSQFTLSVADPANPNVMAGSLVLLMGLLLGLGMFGWGSLTRLERLLICLAVSAMGGILFLTQSRGGWLAFLAAVCLLLILRIAATPRRGWFWLVVVFIFFVIGVGVVYLSGHPEVYRYLVGGGLQVNSKPDLLGDRLEMWSRAIYILEDFPFTGVGMGAYTQVVDRLYPFLRFAPGSAGHAHNLFLQIGSDIGFPGLIAWLAAFICICAGGVSLYRRSLANKDGWLTGLSAGLLAFQLALAIHGLSDAVTWGMVRPAPLVWYLWGLMVAGLLIAPHSLGAVNLADETVLKVDEQFI